MAGTKNIVAANDDEVEQIDLDPCSPHFFKDATAVAAYLVGGNGRELASSRCLVICAIMNRVMLAASENRVCSITEIQHTLAEASLSIGCRNTNETFFESTTHSLTNRQAEVGTDA